MKKYGLIGAVALITICCFYYNKTEQPTANIAHFSKQEKTLQSKLELDINQSILEQAKKCINKTPTRKNFHCPIDINTAEIAINGKLNIIRTGNHYDIHTTDFVYNDKASKIQTSVTTEDQGFYQINDALQIVNFRLTFHQGDKHWYSESTKPFTFSESSDNAIKIVKGSARNYGCNNSYFDWHSSNQKVLNA
ncbi:hypothetical protein [Photobacterium angustum]|uniref:Uncharacterized protein n=1 Tax=Photobacterium angustum TaxID=661 RepID=A0A2S7VKQ5_PHOAN|nr:hypothetical protein [Photobacterium angustum]PQJ62734.1 hypothetical protein BTO08_21180 [Photobacterium angustum]